jgi:hypothetical protein
VAPSPAGLALDLACALDPVVLAERTGLSPDPWQRDALRSRARQTIFLASRQSGKSTVSAVVALHTALYAAPSLVLLLSPGLRQSQELFRKVKDALTALGAAAPAPEAESALRLELPGGSRIVCLPGTEATVRGYSRVALLVVDEASRVKDELYMAIRPMLAVSGGRVLLLSTPFGARGFFHEEWSGGGPDWERVRVTADQVPRITPAFLERERAAIGDYWYRQEYLCQFVDPLESVFASEYIQAALDSSVLPLFPVTTPLESPAASVNGHAHVP